MLPHLTVVVPTYARAEALARCLGSLTRLDYPRDRFDVIVVDDGSACAPEREVQAAGSAAAIRLISQRNAGPGAARNTGVAQAAGDYVAFLGDDCEAEPGWLAAFAARYARTPERLLGGRIVNALPHDPYASASDRLIAFLYAHYNRDPERARFFTPNNLAVPRQVFTALNGFDATIGKTGEDREFCDRWLARGHGISYVPDAIVRHTHPLTLAGFWRQQFGYGRGTRRYRVRQRTGRAGRLAPEPLSFYANLVRYPLTVSDGRRAWTEAALLVVSQTANALGFLAEAITTPRGRYREGDSVGR